MLVSDFRHYLDMPEDTPGPAKWLAVRDVGGRVYEASGPAAV